MGNCGSGGPEAKKDKSSDEKACSECDDGEEQNEF